MAEAVGLGASVLAFATIAAQLSKAIMTVWGAIKDTPEDIQRVTRRLNSLEFILNRIYNEDLATPDGTKHKAAAFWAEQSNQLEHDFAQYKVLAEKLIALLGREKGSISGAKTKFHWFFKRDEVYALDRKIKTHIKTFDTILLFLTFDTVRTTSFDIQEMKYINARSAQKLESLDPVTRDDLTSEISAWKSEFMRSLQQTIPFEPQYKKKTASTTVDSTVTINSASWWTYELPIGILRISRGSRQLNWNKTWETGPSKNKSAAQETSSGIIFDFTPASWFMDKAVMGAFMLHHQKHSEIPALTHMVWSANLLPQKHAALRFAEKGDIKGLQKMFSDGSARPNDRGPSGTSLLHLAALEQQYEMCVFLIDQGADCNAVDYCGRTALHSAFIWDAEEDGRKDQTKNIMMLYESSGGDPTIVGDTGQSAFSEGLLNNRYDLFESTTLKDRDKQFKRVFNALQGFEEIDHFDPLPLTMALCTAYIGSAESQKVVEGSVKRWLKVHGKGFYNLDDRDSYRQVLLQALKHKADELTPDQADMVLRYACTGEAAYISDVLRLLVRPDVVTGDRQGPRAADDLGLGFPALSLVAENGNLEAVEILLAAGADPGADDRVAFRYAVMEGHIDVARRLLGAGEPTARDFLSTAMYGPVELADYFLERGIDVNHLYPNYHNSTALFQAAMYGRLEMVEFLVKRGADVLIKNLRGATARSTALKAGRTLVAEFLRQKEEELMPTQTSTCAVVETSISLRTGKADRSQPDYKALPVVLDRRSAPVKHYVDELGTHSHHTIDSWDSLRFLTLEDAFLIMSGVLVAIWGVLYIFLAHLVGVLWSNRKHVTIRRIKVVFWSICIFSSFAFFIGYLLGRR